METHSPPPQFFDVVIVGAGISGIDAAYLTFYLARRRPSLMKRILLGGVRRALPDYDVRTHFTPR